MKYSVLHLSDLHRDIANEVENPALIESLSRDVLRCTQENPEIAAPSVCIVSGDLIFGVKPTAAGAEAELDRQCDQAEQFLTLLCDEFFGGNPERIVILPGNHDVSFVDVMASAAPVPHPGNEVERAALVRELFQPRSRLRWSWSELCFYRIVDDGRYQGRLERFARIHSHFYQNKRAFDLSPERQLACFDFADLNLTIFAFNSCYNNDPFNRIGAIHPSCIAELSKTLRSGKYNGRLIAAAWHHNISGGPKQADYLDGEVMQHLIDCGVSLGFHGHRHSSLCVTERYQLGDASRKITVIGAGTLCAGASYLNPGEPRSYNIIHIDTNASTGCLRRRNMLNQDFTQPIWGPGYFQDGSDSIPFAIAPPSNTRFGGLDEQLWLEHATQLLGKGDWDGLLKHALNLRESENVRPFLRRALSELSKPHLTKELLWPPQTPEEAIMVGGALLNDWDPEHAQAFLDLECIHNASDASVRDMKERVRRKSL